MGTPTYIPQNDPHDTRIILNIPKCGKKLFPKNIFHPPAWVKSKQNWLLDLGAHFLTPPPQSRCATALPPPSDTQGHIHTGTAASPDRERHRGVWGRSTVR